MQLPITSTKAAATITGHIFERLSECLLGGDRGITNGQVDVCPDAINDESKLLVESKACQRQHAFKVDINQMENYRTVMSEWWAEGLEYQTVYALWCYHAKSISVPTKIKHLGKRRHTKEFRTYGEIIDLVIETTACVKVIDLRIMLRLVELADSWAKPNTCSIKNYSSWKNNTGDPYWVLNVGHRWLRRFMEEPARMLKAMRLDPEQFVWKESTRAGDQIQIDGKIFEPPPVHVFECVSTMPWDYVGRWHDEKDDAPF